MTMNQAAQDYAQIGELTCEDLQDANEECRQDETQPAFEGGAHVTAYRVDGSGAGSYMKAMCPNMPRAQFADGYQPALDQTTPPPPCSGRAGPSAGGRINDAESKILYPEMTAGGGGSIKMSIYHTGDNGPDAMPCHKCRAAICDAEACDIEVWICKVSDTPPEAVRPAAAGLCPPAPANTRAAQAWDQAWADQGMGLYP